MSDADGTGRTRIHLDRVDGLGDFVELEVVLAPDDDEESGEAEAHAVFSKLGVSEGDLVIRRRNPHATPRITHADRGDTMIHKLTSEERSTQLAQLQGWQAIAGRDAIHRQFKSSSPISTKLSAS